MQPSKSFPARFRLPAEFVIIDLDTGTSIETDQTFLLNATDSVQKAGALPHYRRIIAQGGNATTYMTGSHHSVESSPGSAWAKRVPRPGIVGSYPSNEYRMEGAITAIGLTPTIVNETDFTAASNRALSKYYENIASVEAKFKGLVFTGELRESLSMIKSPAKALRTGVSQYLSTLIKKGPKVALRNRKRFVRDTWLEYSFGWTPLISDLDSAIKAFYSSKSVRPIFEMVSGSGRDTIFTPGAERTRVNGLVTVRWRINHTEEYFVRYYGIYHSTGRGVPDAHSYGFRPSEFVPTLWELIPYSFLVDYFTNVGNIVSSWSYRFLAPPWTSRLARRDHLFETTGGSVDKLRDTATYIQWSGGEPGSIAFRRVNFTRTPSVALTLPSLELEVPGMKSVKWVNMLALTSQLGSARKSLNR